MEAEKKSEVVFRIFSHCLLFYTRYRDVLISLGRISTPDASPRQTIRVRLQPCVFFCLDASLLYRCEGNCHSLVLVLFLKCLCFPPSSVTFHSLISLHHLLSRCFWHGVLIWLLCLFSISFFRIFLAVSSSRFLLSLLSSALQFEFFFSYYVCPHFSVCVSPLLLLSHDILSSSAGPSCVLFAFVLSILFSALISRMCIPLRSVL